MKNLSMISVSLSKLSLVFFLFLGIESFANSIFPISYKSFLDDDCDACGCSSGGGSLGMGGVIDNNFIGIRYLHQKYESKDGIFKNSPKIDEYFNTIQIWSRLPITSKLEIQAFVPYHFHSRKYVNKSTQINGLGDVTIVSNFTVLDKKQANFTTESSNMSIVNHLLKIGAGVKLPTGKYDGLINNTTNPSFQLGTGSVDYIANLQYVFKYNNFGTTNMLNYYFKTENDNEFRFGNQFNFNSTFFYVFKDEKENLFVPSVGVSGEFYQTNKHFGIIENNSNGHTLLTSLGIEYNSKKITFGASGVYPIHQNLAQGAVKVKYRSSLYLNYNF